MNRKIILPLLALVLAVSACQLTPSTPAPATSVVPPAGDTALPAAPTNTPLPPASSAPTSLTLDGLKNGTYHAPAYDHTVTLVNGAYSNGSSTDPYSVQMLDMTAFGDLNGDGVGDAAILLVENGGGSGQFVSVILVVDAGGTASQAGEAQLGDRPQVKSMNIASGTLSINMLVQGPTDPMCCPSMAETQSYRLVANKLWLTRLTSQTPDNHERSISILAPADNSNVSNPFTISGSVTMAPFENTLAYRIYLPDGTKVNEASLMVDSAGVAGGPGTFSQNFDLSNAGLSGVVIVQFLDLSAADGTTLALGSVVVNLH